MQKRRTLYVSAFLTLSLLASISAPVYAHSNHNPAGNNGFVQVNKDTMPDGIPQNQPHVGCTFYLEFYDYDQNNNYANVNFELQAPTNKTGDKLTVVSGNLNPSIGKDPAGGSNDMDAREAYTLNFTGTPQAQQGYHVELTVKAPGSKGSDVKHKVFWVQPCEQMNATVNAASHELGANTTSSTQTPGVTELPNTGAGLVGTLLLGGFAAAVAYTLSLWRQKRAVGSSN